jgi:pimeloyl-ACP methyl ester carboxylesterase
MSKPLRVPPALLAGVAAGAALVGGLAALSLTGIGIKRPVSHPNPAHSLDDAWQRVEALRTAEEGAVHSAGHTRLLAPTDPAPETPTVVLMHGLTMTPDQFAWVGGVLRDAGYRVLLPLMPDHGRTDGSSAALADVRAEDLTAWADSVIDIAHGFGGPVWVLGLSAGGLMASWCARVRPEVTRVAAIAPFAAPHGYRWSIVRMAARLEGMLPATMHYWDPVLQADAELSPYGYPGFPLRGASAYMRVSEALRDGRLAQQPNLESAVLVLNDGDDQVSDPRARELFRSAFYETAIRYEEITLPGSLGWKHDFIDPWLSPRPNPKAVLEVLLGALGIEGPEATDAIEAYETSETTA